jgi:HSP20 family protein
MNFMPTRRSHVFHLLRGLNNDIDEASSAMDNFSHFFGEPTIKGIDRPSFCPHLSATELENKFEIEVEVPGINKDDVRIDLSDNILVIKGEKKYVSKEENEDIHFDERYYGSFRREMKIPVNCDPERIEATHKDGILNITIPKIKEQEPKVKKIEIK